MGEEIGIWKDGCILIKIIRLGNLTNRSG